jgi:hypothetical protein
MFATASTDKCDLLLIVVAMAFNRVSDRHGVGMIVVGVPGGINAFSLLLHSDRL